MGHCVFNDTATTEIYTLSLHDALPISRDQRPSCAATDLGGLAEARPQRVDLAVRAQPLDDLHSFGDVGAVPARSEEHTSELQSRQYLVCRLLLEKKKTKYQ